MSFPAYASYKDSGEEWLREVPSHWQRLSLKRCIRFTTGWTPPTGRDDLYSGSNPWATIADMDGRILTHTVKCVSDEAVQNAGIVFSPRGSLLFSFKLSIGQVAFAGEDIYTNEAIATFLPGDKIDLDFAYYAFPLFVSANAAENIYGAKLLNQELIRNAALLLPPPREQRAIADFLDRETAKIDALVEAQRQLIAMLKEKRQAVISHAVTKGLDPSAPLKPSGIPWLGDVPGHWEVVALSRLVQSRRPITYGIVQPGPADPNGRYMIRGQDYSSGWVAPEEIFRVSSAVEEPYRRARVRSGDLVITIVGAGVGNVAVVPDELEGANLTQTTARIAPDFDIVDPSFLQLALTSNLARTQVAIYQKGAAQPGLNLEHLKAFRLLVPALSEQREIARRASEATASLVLLITEAGRACVFLAERRAALISAAVTGKIDVRGLVAQLEAAEAA